eukprot:1285372-Ditylum_brightwellii.AAC.1
MANTSKYVETDVANEESSKIDKGGDIAHINDDTEAALVEEGIAASILLELQDLCIRSESKDCLKKKCIFLQFTNKSSLNEKKGNHAMTAQSILVSNKKCLDAL